ncbi:hypothetical protein [Xylophilus sp. GOD-11R]|uniref:hypothetical protein n=1 Tax=Xylophilus sp. GOD-11R TaxID=3089814 RepID=UPI00298CB759|nr:hypothetical protein [Xylophilus sp. GOD-11R]WPB58345.1 hypothetical protein R9X41_06795 [Xylophilus sp. GOD-11R]
MACLDEKLTAGLAGTAVAAGGVGLIASTATGPAFFAAAVGWLTACAGYGASLAKYAACLAANGQPEFANAVREKAAAIEREIDAFRQWARSIGAPF